MWSIYSRRGDFREHNFVTISHDLIPIIGICVSELRKVARKDLFWEEIDHPHYRDIVFMNFVRLQGFVSRRGRQSHFQLEHGFDTICHDPIPTITILSFFIFVRLQGFVS